MPSPLADLLRDLAAVFAGLGLRWYLFDAQAAIVHGAARLTADVDATVDVGTLSPAALGHAMTRGGFDARVADLPAFATRTRVLPLVHRGTSMPVDVVLAGPGLEEAFLARARIEDVGGVRVPNDGHPLQRCHGSATNFSHSYTGRLGKFMQHHRTCAIERAVPPVNE